MFENEQILKSKYTFPRSRNAPVNGFLQRGGGGGIRHTHGVWHKIASLGLGFNLTSGEFVLPQGREDCQHFVGEDKRSTIHNVTATIEPYILARLASIGGRSITES